jgi:hypothetical protein
MLSYRGLIFPIKVSSSIFRLLDNSSMKDKENLKESDEFLCKFNKESLHDCKIREIFSHNFSSLINEGLFDIRLETFSNSSKFNKTSLSLVSEFISHLWFLILFLVSTLVFKLYDVSSHKKLTYSEL